MTAMTVSIDEVESRASAATGGLEQFGDDDYRAGLDVLLAAAADSPHAGPELDERVRRSAVSALASRLSSEAAWTAHPQTPRSELPPQVVIIGLPRSGTTALHQIMAADASFQWIPAWLAPRPKPRPPVSEWDEDPERRAQVVLHRSRGPNRLHDVGPDDPEECIQIMRQSFVNMTWVSSEAVPAYHEWFIEQDERPSYRRYSDNLRLIGGADHERPWLLKNPSHTFGMASMLDVFPEAVFVHIYRDPVDSIVSGCSLITSITSGSGGGFKPNELGAHRLRIWALAADRMMAARDAAPDRKFLDVDYRAFVSDPVQTVRSVYGELDRPLGPETIAAMKNWAAQRPQNQHGTHRYAASEFGLSEQIIRARMAAFTERFAIEPAGRS